MMGYEKSISFKKKKESRTKQPSNFELKKSIYLEKMQNQFDDRGEQIFDLEEVQMQEKKMIITTYVAGAKRKNYALEFITNHLIISTSSAFYQLWKFMMILMNFVSSFHYAYAASVLDQVEEHEKNAFESYNYLYQAAFVLDMVFKVLVEHHYETS